MKGYILWGVNNIYAVQASNGQVYEARIKGKVLHREKCEHNALVVGDWVELTHCDDKHALALIVAGDKRRNSLWRYNLKTQKRQTIAANVDQMVVVVSGRNPSFRSGFLDRALVMAQAERLSVLIVMNKKDLGLKKEQVALWNFYCKHFTTVLISVKMGWGLDKLRSLLKGKLSVVFGQSGVGKSSLINALIPHADQQTQSISEKYNRGRHTTVYSLMLQDKELRLVDTPGIKEFDITGISKDTVEESYPELRPFLGNCRFNNCCHLHEPQCALIEAFEAGYILPERWQSFLNLIQGKL